MKLIQDRVRALRVTSLMVLDVVVINASVLFSLLLRFELSLTELELSGFVEAYTKIALSYTAVSLLFFMLLRLYRSLWRFAGIDELRNIAVAVLFSNIGLWALCRLTGIYLPRSLPILNFLVLLALIGGFRFAYRIARRVRNQYFTGEERRETMLIGAGAGGSGVVEVVVPVGSGAVGSGISAGCAQPTSSSGRVNSRRFMAESAESSGRRCRRAPPR